jgi:hypothetical protein
MARKRPQPEDEEVTEGIEAEEAAPAAPSGHEFVAEASHKPKSDAWTLMLILTFLAFSVGAGVAGREAWEHYDVEFWMFSKEGKPVEKTMSDEPVSAPAPATDTSAPPAAPPPATNP